MFWSNAYTGMGSSLGQPVSIKTLVRRGSPNLYQPQETPSNAEELLHFKENLFYQPAALLADT